MNDYKKFARRFLGLELVFIGIANLFYYIWIADPEPVIRKLQEKTDTIYKVFYTRTDYRTWILMDIALGILFFMSVFLVVYMKEKIIKPFHRMEHLTEELAKGNLSMPIPAEKSKYLGRFLWGMDMLRNTLEDNKEKQLQLQKERKTLILSLAHDIKTPLSAINLYVRVLKEGLYTTEEKRVEAYHGIEKNVKEIEDYISEITEASREDFLHPGVRNKFMFILSS